jgi:hypothetical protein
MAPATDLMSPLEYMTTIDGERIIPLQVTATVAAGFLFSALLINAKPWSPRLFLLPRLCVCSTVLIPVLAVHGRASPFAKV